MSQNPWKPKDQIEEDNLAKKLWKKESSRLLKTIDRLKIQFKLHLTKLLSYFTTLVRLTLSYLPLPQPVLEQNQGRMLNETKLSESAKHKSNQDEHDSSKYVSNRAAFPRSAIGYVYVTVGNNESIKLGIGVLFGEDLVITPISNLISENCSEIKAEMISFMLEENGTETSSHSIRVAKVYISKDCEKNSYVILVLEECVGLSTGYFELRSATKETIKEAYKNTLQLLDEENPRLILNSQRLINRDNVPITFSISGSPLYYFDEDSQRYYIIGLLSNGNTSDSLSSLSAIWITNLRLESILKFVNETQKKIPMEIPLEIREEIPLEIREETPLLTSKYSGTIEKDVADAKSYEENDEVRALVDGTSKEAELTIPRNSSAPRNEPLPTQELLQMPSKYTEAPQEFTDEENAQINSELKIDQLIANSAYQHNSNAKLCSEPKPQVKQPMKFQDLKKETLNPDYGTTTNTEDASNNSHKLQKIQEINIYDATNKFDDVVQSSQVTGTSFYVEKSILLLFLRYKNIISQFFSSFSSLKEKICFESLNWLIMFPYLPELLRSTYSKYQSHKINPHNNKLLAVITAYTTTNADFLLKNHKTFLQIRNLAFLLDHPWQMVYEIGAKTKPSYSLRKRFNFAAGLGLVEQNNPSSIRSSLVFPKKSNEEIDHTTEREINNLERLYKVFKQHYISLDLDGIMTNLHKIKKFIKLLLLLGFIGLLGLLGMLKTPQLASILRTFLTNAISQLLVLESQTSQIFSKTKETCKYQSFIKQIEELIATFNWKNTNSRAGQHQRSQIATTFFHNQLSLAHNSSSDSQNSPDQRVLREENEEREEQSAQHEQIRANLRIPDGLNQEANHQEHPLPQGDVEPVDNTLRFNPVEENRLRLMSNRSIEEESMEVHPRDDSVSEPHFNAKSAIQVHSPDSPRRTNPDANLDEAHPIHSAHSLRCYSRLYIQVSLRLLILTNQMQDPTPPRQRSIEFDRVSTLDVTNIETSYMQVFFIADIRIFPTNHDHYEDAFQPNQLGALTTPAYVDLVQILNQATRHLIVEDSDLRDMISGVIEEPVMNNNTIDGEIGEQNNPYQDTHLLEEDSMHDQIDPLRHHLTQAVPHQRLNGLTEENVHSYNLFQGNYLFILGTYNSQNPERITHSYDVQGVSYNDPNLDENPIVNQAMEIQNISNQNNSATQPDTLDEYQFVHDLSSSRIIVQNINPDPINVYALEHDGEDDEPNLFASIQSNLAQTQPPRTGRVDRNLEETAPISEIDLLAYDNIVGMVDYNNGLTEAQPQNYPTNINDYSENQWDEAAISQIRTTQRIPSSFLRVEETFGYPAVDINYLELGFLTESVIDMYPLTIDDANEAPMHLVEVPTIADFALTVQEDPRSIEVGDIDQYVKEQSHYSISGTLSGGKTCSTLSSQNQNI